MNPRLRVCILAPINQIQRGPLRRPFGEVLRSCGASNFCSWIFFLPATQLAARPKRVSFLRLELGRCGVSPCPPATFSGSEKYVTFFLSHLVWRLADSWLVSVAGNHNFMQPTVQLHLCFKICYQNFKPGRQTAS